MKKAILLEIIIAAFFSFLISSCGGDNVVAPTDKDVTIQISDGNIHHAYITDFYPNTNFMSDDDFAALAWKKNDTPYVGRTLFKFNLTSIPPNATIKSATLLLNYDLQPIHYNGAGHHQEGGSNTSYMQRVTQSWGDSVVTWFTQPSVTANNQIVLDSSSSSFQNYSVDMTAAISDMYANPQSNFGFLFRLQTEVPYRVMGFSAGLTNRNLKPILQVTYTVKSAQ